MPITFCPPSQPKSLLRFALTRTSRAKRGRKLAAALVQAQDKAQKLSIECTERTKP